MKDVNSVKSKKISLGFTDQKFEPGIHICQIYSEEDERHNALVDFVISGLEGGENTACFTEKETAESLAKQFAEKGISFDEISSADLFSLSETESVYFENGTFNPDKMLNLLKSFYKDSMDRNCKGARVIGEMTNKVESVDGGSRLLEYESRVSMLLRKYPVNTVCQYKASDFDGGTIMDVLKVHPYMIIKGSVVQNPFFIKPEDYLSSIESK